jgi:hypothetical protein
VAVFDAFKISSIAADNYFFWKFFFGFFLKKQRQTFCALSKLIQNNNYSQETFPSSTIAVIQQTKSPGLPPAA